MRIYAHRLLTPAGFQPDLVVHTEGDTIVSIEKGTSGDLEVPVLCAGMIDEHNHGGFGFEAASCDPQGLQHWLLFLARRGVTGVLYTPSGDPDAVAFAAWAMREQQNGRLPGARILGVHLEGPFISKKRLGAISEEIVREPTIEQYKRIVGEHGDIVRLITLAPELPGAPELIAYLRRRGVRVQAGHSDANYDQGIEAFSSGVGGVCHTFNALRGIHHREPNLLTAALLSPGVFCEAICDLVHLHPAVIRLLHQNKGPGRMVLVSDATGPMGLPDGRYDYRSHPFVVKDGVSRTPAGNLSGGSAEVSKCARNCIRIGIPAEDALTMGSLTPARHLGLDGRYGSVEPGKAAALCAMDETYAALFGILGQDVYAEDKA